MKGKRMKNNVLLEEESRFSSKENLKDELDFINGKVFTSKKGLLFKGDCFDLFDSLKSNCIDSDSNINSLKRFKVLFIK